MTHMSIQSSLERLTQFFRDHPERGRSTDKAAVATIETGLRCRAESADGAVLVSDMPRALGGEATAPTPGWLLRAALANCDATMIALRAAQLGVVLTTLEVTVDSSSDDRGMLGLAESIPPGPLEIRTRVRIGSANAAPESLRQIVAWAEAHSPVGDALRRALPDALEVVIVATG